MSVLGSTIIRQIVDQQKIYEPDQILHLLDQGVYESLNQNFTDIRDGMEAAILLIDEKKKQISFSGAGLPLVFFQNGELNYIKGEARAIGGSRKLTEKEFVCQDIVLNGEVSLYLFTDGFADQYDRLGQKKFLIRNFRALLTEIQDLNMEDQFGSLLDTLDHWKGKQKQTDDILVLGVKVKTY
jgi:serine phosphatase RsbU (regulator of sigma subunit)